MLCRLTFYEDFDSNTQLLSQEVKLALLQVVLISNLSHTYFHPLAVSLLYSAVECEESTLVSI